MGLLGGLGYYARMASGLYALVRAPRITDPDGMIRHQLENRERHFLELARRAIFSNPVNPYYQLFQLAGCSFDDLAAGLRRDGLEATLGALHRQGVYLLHDEFKGKKPIVRSNREIAATPSSFRNPLVKEGMESSSGGSRSSGTRVRKSVAQRMHEERYAILSGREFAFAGMRHVQLFPILPAPEGIFVGVRNSRLGCPAEKWFSTCAKSPDSTHYQVATHCWVRLARLFGGQVPFPTYLPPDDFSPVAAWIAGRREQRLACAVHSYTSPAVRVAAAAIEKGLDIRGTLFLVAGETLTDAKRRVVESTGAEVFPGYVISEIGPIGYACRQMTAGNCAHVFRDSVAVINHCRVPPLSDTEVNTLLFTTLLPFAGLVLINVDMDDAGVLAPATCDCTFSRMGFTTQIRDIFSYGKLTGHGVTLVGTDVLRILESVLPARFGGGPTDYQLLEQDAAHQARVVLRVSRRLPLSSLAAVRECFVQELRQLHGGAVASRMWRTAEALEVVHDDPVTTPAGKVLPLHLLGPGVRISDAS